MRFEAPIFEPHLTLCGGLLHEQTARLVLAKLPARSTYELEVEAIEVAESFTKTLFIRFVCSDELNELHSALSEALQLPEIEEFDPHLSLLYKELAWAKKKELRSTIAMPFQRIRFTELSLIAHPAEITTRSDVEAWQTIAQRSLAESTR